jgi:dienelactone hydrolase
MAHKKSKRWKAVTTELLSIAIVARCFSFAFVFTPTCLRCRNRNIHGSVSDFHQLPIMSATIQQYFISPVSWTLLVPSRFENSSVSSDGCRFAKDNKYLMAVLQSWKMDFSINDPPIETCSYVYQDVEETPLYGHIVRPATSDLTRKRPGILLFHTAAGPQDVFLFYKAYLLVKNVNCVVLICDILSDSDGWAWASDRSHYNHVRNELAKDDHRLLQSRVTAAILAMSEVLSNDGPTSRNIEKDCLAVMGWCLGGQPVLEVPRVQMSTEMDFSVRTLVTFHGVFGREAPLTPLAKTNAKDCGKVLIFNGSDDTFVSTDDLKSAKSYFESGGYKVNIARMEGAKHGFTNPAQAFNENNLFDYNDAAAKTSWEMTVKLLQESLLS